MFRILSFTIHKHPLLGGKKFDLTNPEEDKADNYYSVIIGPNGTGKSYLLNSIIEVFNELALFKDNPKYRFRKRFTINYTLEDNEFTVSTEGKEPVIRKKTFDISVSELKLPVKWLASSVTINDKYPILNNARKKQIPQYNYLGIRSASNNAFISRIKINAVLYLLDILQKANAKRLLSVYKTLSLKPEIQIVFIGGPMLKLDKKDKSYVLFKTSDKIIEAHRLFIKKNKSKTNYRVARYLKYLESSEMPDRIFQFMKANENIFQKYSKAGMQLRYRINLDNDSGIEKIKADWNILLAMLDLELIKISKFLITKDSEFKFEEASSGESHLLTSIHGILANIEDNSLVIIDEPEVSLHPNWQIDYFDILKSLVDNYKGVNVIISTHSNLLVSSLKNNESRITSLRRDKGTISVQELDFETYGWDPESILYNVFEVATLRNKYFELDLRKLIALITEKSEDFIKIRQLREKVGKYILSNDDDPLILLIKEVDEYLSKQ